jgi:colanic acid/amylovoran biosynthesis glycosyltransferase
MGAPVEEHVAKPEARGDNGGNVPSPPVIAHFCSTFLKRDMQHLYRQITGLQSAGEFESRIVTRSRENVGAFWYWEKKVRVIRKHPLRFFRRAWHRSIQKKPAVPLSFRECRDILYELKRIDAEVMHVYFGHIAVELLPVLRCCSIPIVVSFHGADAGVHVGSDSRAGRDLKEVFARAALVQARSEALLDDLRSLGCPPEKLRLLRTGLLVEGLESPERVVPENGAWRLLQACRLVEKKGLAVTIEAFSRVQQRFPGARLTLAGDGTMEADLRRRVAELGLEQSVRFTGFLGQDDLRKEFADAHLFLHPSRHAADGNREGVPNALLEAMASGLSVVATRHGGIPEAVEDGVHGRLVDEDDVDAFTNALMDWLSDGEKVLAAGKAARDAVEAGFSQRFQVEGLSLQYREVLRAAPDWK